MTDDNLEAPRTCHYFVDEAGDGTLFNKRKRIVVGTDGCSNFFTLGVLEALEPKRCLRPRTQALKTALDQARKNLRAKWGVEATRPIEVAANHPKDHGGLQAVDYFM